MFLQAVPLARGQVSFRWTTSHTSSQEEEEGEEVVVEEEVVVWDIIGETSKTKVTALCASVENTYVTEYLV